MCSALTAANAGRLSLHLTFNLWSLQNCLIEETEERDLNESPVLDSLFKNDNFIVILFCSHTLTLKSNFDYGSERAGIHIIVVKTASCA